MSLQDQKPENVPSQPSQQTQPQGTNDDQGKGNTLQDQKPKSVSSQPSQQAQPQGTNTHQSIDNKTSIQDAKALKADDLWRRAYECLHLADNTLAADYEATILEDFKDNVEVSQTKDIKSQMSTIVNLQKQKMESKQWTFQWWGNTENVRDLVDGTLKLAQSVSSLISLGMTFAPVYVSLPWSAVCALIPVSHQEILRATRIDLSRSIECRD
jgi:hypothetical protein